MTGSLSFTVTAYVITHTLQTNWIETITGHPKHQPDRSSSVAGDERTVRIARGHAYLTRSGALQGLLKLVFLAPEKKMRNLPDSGSAM